MKKISLAVCGLGWRCHKASSGDEAQASLLIPDRECMTDQSTDTTIWIPTWQTGELY